MGGNCCIAARDKPSPERLSCDVSNYRNVRDSPSWSFRWDNRTHIEDIMDNPSRFSHHNSLNVSSEIKSVANTENEGLSDGGSSSDAIHINKRHKSPGLVGIAGSLKSVVSDRSTGTNSSPEDTSTVAAPSDIKPSISSPSFSFKSTGPSTSNTQTPSLKSLSETDTCISPDTGRSHGGSSEGWSKRTFSELVATSSHTGNLVKSHVLSSPPSLCRICSKSLKEKFPETFVSAVLICGHVYHAECLESVTSETDRYDPPCPVCTNVVKFKNRISRRAVADIDAEGASGSEYRKVSSMKPFLKRHFSIGPRPPPARSASENDATRKKRWFSSLYRRV